MSNRVCPFKSIEYRCGELCGYYDEHAQQCSQVSQAMALRDIAEQLKRNADAMLDYSPAKEPVEVELQKVYTVEKGLCDDCKHEKVELNEKPCCDCGWFNKVCINKWEPK